MEEQKKIQILTPTTPSQAVKQAKSEIREERKGLQLGLKTEWESFNRAVRKYLRFGQIYLFAGLSGSGKSYLLNKIINNFYDKFVINRNFNGTFIVLYFTYEMSAAAEILRTVSDRTNFSYNKILNSVWDREQQEYTGLTDEELKSVEEHLDKIAKRPILYFETAGNLKQLRQTAKYYSDKYPNSKLVVAIDHTLLSEPEGNESLLELMANTGKTAIWLKKQLNAMVLMLGQLNNNIETYVRIKEAVGHYPIKSDIYAQGQLYNACDSVFTIHQPSMLKIGLYGLKKLPTKNLIHLQCLKARHGKVGSVWLRNELDRGVITETSINELKGTKDISEKDDDPLA